MSFQFTRYLYELEEVKYAFLISLLNKNQDALFWAYELQFSGYEKELVDLIWKIYYDFYASLNPGFEIYLLNKNTISNFINDNKYLANIVNNFLIRPYNLDVFMARQIIKNFEIDFIKEDLKKLLELKDYVNIAFYILEIIKDENIIDNINIIFNYFHKDKDKHFILWNKVKTYNDPKVILLSYIFRFYSEIENLKLGKNIYIVVNDEEIEEYKISITKSENFPAWKTLGNVNLCAIDESKWLNLFKLKRDKENIVEFYHYKWLYYASKSPLWASRIAMFNGTINNEKKEIEFQEEDDLQYFYGIFGYEPDEQPLNIQNKCLEITKDKTRNWENFYKKYRNNGLFIVDNEYLEEMEKIVY